MPIDYSALAKAPRLLLQATLKPLQGERFQATGFADLGAARYTLPDGTEKLLVESAQSVANRCEAASWDEATGDVITELKGLPYILVKLPDGKVTNSILEAHRINSEYIAESKLKGKPFLEVFADEISYKANTPVDFKKFHLGLLKYDPNSMLHGTFLEELGGRLRVARALSGFIEASGVVVAESGGVKFNRIDPGRKDGDGNVPFHRTEFVAEKITAFFNLDLALLRGYGLGPDATALLITLALFKVRRFLSIGLRLRSACDLEVVGDLVVERPKEGFTVPDEAALLAECTRLIAACGAAGLFAEPRVTEVSWQPDKKKKEAAGEDE